MVDVIRVVGGPSSESTHILVNKDKIENITSFSFFANVGEKNNAMINIILPIDLEAEVDNLDVIISFKRGRNARKKSIAQLEKLLETLKKGGC
jgi:hypothetical protein